MDKEVLQPKSAAATLRRGLSLLVALAMILTWAPPVYATEPVPQEQQVEIATGESALKIIEESEPETAEENLPETAEENLPETAEENLPETIEGNTPETDAGTPETAEQSGNRLEAVQTLIDALPEAETINEQTAEQVKAQLAAIDAAKLELTDEELDALDIARYRAVVAALHALENQPGEGSPQPLAESVVGAFTVEGDPAGYSYANSILTITNDAALTIRNTDPAATTDRIFVGSGVSANITLAGVNIDVSTTSEAAFEIAYNSTGNVTVTLADGTENTLISGLGCAGLQKNGNDSSGTLTIQGEGTLTAIGGDYGAGIGGVILGNGSNITISGGTVTATGKGGGAGIGGGGGGIGDGSNITITGGTVTATGGGTGAGIGGGEMSSGTVTITGGTVTAIGGTDAAGIGNGSGGSGGGFSTTATDGTKGNAWIEASSISDNDDTTAWNGIIFQGNEGQVYGNPTLTTDAEIKAGKTLTVLGGKTLTIANGVTLTNNGTIIQNGTINGSVGGTIIKKDLTVTGGVEGTDYTYEYGNLIVRKETPLTISGTSTTERIVVAGNVNANITLENVSIDMSQNRHKAAFEIEGGTGNVTVTLEGENTLKSGTNCAGLMIDGADGTLTIQGDGSLTAIGGNDGAGIGGYGGQGCNITIAGGNVTATGGENAAGIGGTLSTGTDGNAWIVASSISNTSHSDEWSGVIFDGSDGRVYGDSYTLTANAEIPSGKTLTVPNGTTLTIADGVTLTNDGTITNNGTIIQNGTINGSVGGTIIQKGLTVTGGTAGTDYTYENGVLTVLSDANLTISMKKGVTPPTTDRIEVAKDVSANITLAGVNIDVSTTSEAAFQIADNSTGNVTITLADGTTNTLRSGLGRAGVQRSGSQNSGSLTIRGDSGGTGSLTAFGGTNGRGIYSNGDITISGNVTATGWDFPGIEAANSNTITISGGNVVATSQGTRAFGHQGIKGVEITISGGNVKATGIFNSEGISGTYITIRGADTIVNATGAGTGAGIYGGSTVRIEGGNVTATGGENGVGIKSWQNGVTISGGTVTATGTSAGIEGKTFTTGTSGRAFIKATGATAIKANFNEGDLSGVIFQNGVGQMYGTPTLTTGTEIKVGESLAVPEGATLTVPSGTTLTNNGTLTIEWGGSIAGDGRLTGNGTFQTENLTADDIVLPANLVYNGNNRTEEIKTALASLTTTICGQPFQITGWTLSNVVTSDNFNYTVTYTRDSAIERITKDVTLGQSGTTLTASFEEDKMQYGYGEDITIKVTVEPSGQAPITRLRAVNAVPTKGQVAVYEGGTQVSEPQTPTGTACTFTIPAKKLGAGTHALTVKYTASGTMAKAEFTLPPVTVAACTHPGMNDDGNCTLCGEAIAATVQIGDTTTYYTDITSAWNFAQGRTAAIKMLQDQDIGNSFLTMGSGNLTLTMAEDVTLRGNHTKQLILATGGTLNLTDCTLRFRENGNSRDYCSCLRVEGAEVTITNCRMTAGGEPHNFLDNGTAVEVLSGVINIHSGTFTAKGGALSVGHVKNDPEVNLYGGTFIGTNHGSKAIWVVSPSEQTLGDLLAEGYGYKKGTTWVTGNVLTKKYAYISGTVEVKQLPVNITTQPQSQTVTYGYTDAPTLTVAAAKTDSGTGDIAYQWYRVKEGSETADVAVSNADDLSFTVPLNLNAGSHSYYCVVTCDGYPLKSDTATITVNKKALTATITGTTTKTYDGTIYTESDLSIKLDGAEPGYDVIAAASYEYNSANVSEATTITATGISLSGTDKDNYELPDTTMTTTGTITPKPLTITDATLATKIYNGDATANVENVIFDGVVSGENLKIGTDYTATAEFTDASAGQGKTATVTVTLAGNSNYAFAEGANTYVLSDLTINQAAPTDLTVTLTPDTFVYDGAEKKPTVTVVDGNGNEIPVKEYNVGYNSNTDAGENAATVTVTANPNGNYSFDPIMEHFTIAPASITDNDVSITGTYTYNGSEHKPSPVVTVNGTLLLADRDYDVDYGNNTDAGPAKVIVKGKGNYIGTVTKEFTINKADMLGVSATGHTGIYDGNAHGITVTGYPAGATVKYGTVKGTYPHTASPTYTDAGNYTVYYEMTSPNHNPVNGSAAIVIEKKSISEPKAKEGLTYTGAEQTGVEAGEGYSLTGTSVAKKAGSYSATAQLDGNHCWTGGTTEDKTLEWSIAKKKLTVASITGTTEKEYDGTTGPGYSGYLNVALEDGVFTQDYAYAVVTSYSYDSANAGERTITANIALHGDDKDNYSLPATATVEGKITQKPLIIGAHCQEVIYGDPVQSGVNQVTARYLVPGDELTKITLTAEITGPAGGNVIPSDAVIKRGNTDVTGNYDITYWNGNLVFIDKFIPAPEQRGERTYNGKPQQTTVEAGEGYELIYNAEATNAGSYRVDAALKLHYVWDDGTHEDKQYIWGIAQKEVTVAITAEGGTYNGKPFEATATLSGVVEGETVPVTLTYYKKGETDALPGAPTDAGKYTVAATITDSNYKLKPTTKDFTIQKAALTVTVNDQTKTYGDPDSTLTYTLDGALAGDDELKLALAHSGEDIGTYDITDPNVGMNNPNYAVTVEKGTMTIEQRSIESAAVVLGEALTANGTEQTQTIQSVTVKNSAGEDLAVTYDVTGNTGTGAGQYTMTLTGTGNFTGRITLPFTIGAPAVTPPDPTPGDKPKPETKPTQPENQGDAAKKDDAAQQNTAAAAQQSAAATATVPRTGDDSAIELWFLLFALSAVGLGAVAIQKRKNNR